MHRRPADNVLGLCLLSLLPVFLVFSLAACAEHKQSSRRAQSTGKIAYVRAGTLYVREADGKTSKLFKKGVADQPLDFSPNGSKLLFGLATKREIIIYDFKKKTIQKLPKHFDTATSWVGDKGLIGSVLADTDTYYDLAQRKPVRFASRFSNIRVISKERRNGEWLVVDRPRSKERRISLGRSSKWRTVAKFESAVFADWIGEIHIGVIRLASVENEGFDVLIINTRTGKIERRLRQTTSSYASPGFRAAPDGDKLLLTAATGNEDQETRLVDIKTGKALEIVSLNGVLERRDPVWLPDSLHFLILGGQRIFSPASGLKLLLMDIDGKIVKTIATGVENFAYSPN